jgi:vacuolar protein sorting-associated protein 72
MAAVASRERRKTAGKRMTSLLGKAQEEDDTFWGHDTWAEDDSGNDSFHDSDGDSAMKKDEFDSDFDDSESDHDEEELAAGADEEADLQKSERGANQRKNTYVDIKKASSGLIPTRRKGMKGHKRIMGDGINAGIVLNAPVAAMLVASVPPNDPLLAQQSLIPPTLVSFPPPKKVAKTAPGASVKMTLASTRQRRSAHAPRRLREVRSTAPSDLKRSSVGKSGTCGKSATSSKKSKRRRYGQEELLLEAVNETEPGNSRWLLARKRVQENSEKDKDLMSMRNASRGKVVQKYHSRRGCLITLTFPEMDSVPEILTRSNVAVTKPNPTYCVITGERARYRDPLTNLGYLDTAAFKELRRRHREGVTLDQRTVKKEDENLTSTSEDTSGVKDDDKMDIPDKRSSEIAKDAAKSTTASEKRAKENSFKSKTVTNPESIVSTTTPLPIVSATIQSSPNATKPKSNGSSHSDDMASSEGNLIENTPASPATQKATIKFESPPVSPTRRASRRKWKPSLKLLDNIVAGDKTVEAVSGAHTVRKEREGNVEFIDEMEEASKEVAELTTPEKTEEASKTVKKKATPKVLAVKEVEKPSTNGKATSAAPKNKKTTKKEPGKPPAVTKAPSLAATSTAKKPSKKQQAPTVPADVTSDAVTAEKTKTENGKTESLEQKTKTTTTSSQPADIANKPEPIYMVGPEDSQGEGPRFVTQSELIMKAITTYSKFQEERNHS